MIGLTRHTHLIKAVLAGTVLLLYLCGFCQSVTFNTHHHLGLKYIQPGGILPINTGYLYVGLAIDTMEYRNNWIIGKLDPAGNPVCYNIYRHSLHHQKLTWSDILPYNDSTFITIGSDSLLNGFVVLFNENCDTIATKAIRLNYQGSTLEEIRITDFLRTSDDGYVAIGNASFADTRQQGVILKIGKPWNWSGTIFIFPVICTRVLRMFQRKVMVISWFLALLIIQESVCPI